MKATLHKHKIHKGEDMIKTVRAKFSHGVLEPLEAVELPEGKEFTVIITDEPSKKEWGSFAITSFAENWENEKDAIYDDWKELYNVS